MVSLDVELLMVRFNVTMLSQPFDVCNVSVNVPVEVYVLPYHTKLSQAVAEVSLVIELLMVRFNVTMLSQPLDAVNVSEYRPLVV